MKTKNFIRPLIASLLLLFIPFIGNLVSDDFNWNFWDFLIMGIILFIAGLVLEFIAIKIKKRNHRIILFATLLLTFLYIWAELGVGILFNFGN